MLRTITAEEGRLSVSELPEDAIEAAAKALYADSGGILESRWTYCIPQAERALAAALPFLERATRDKDAAEIEAARVGTHDDPACFAVNCDLDHEEVRREVHDAQFDVLAENELDGYEALFAVLTRHSFHDHDCQTTHCKAMFIWNSSELTHLLHDAFQRGATDARVARGGEATE